MRASTTATALLSALSIVFAACDDGAGTGGAGGAGSSTGTTGSTSSTASTTTATGTTSSTSGATTTASSGGGDPCANLAPGPFTPTVITQKFDGSEDFTFDDAGGIVSRAGNAIVRVDANDMATTIGTLPQSSYGLRYGPTKDLFIALPNAGKIVKVTQAGMASDFATGLSGPNGVYPDLAGNLWVTEFSGGRVIKVDPMGAKTTIVQGQSSPNGVVLDSARNVLFYTGYSAGKLFRVDPAGGTPTEVGGVNGASLDGLTLDECGNVYAVDQGNSRVYRFLLDASGNLVGTPELLADFPQNVANAQFGQTGFDPHTLYLAGNPGVVYAIAVGVGGAPIPP